MVCVLFCSVVRAIVFSHVCKTFVNWIENGPVKSYRVLVLSYQVCRRKYPCTKSSNVEGVDVLSAAGSGTSTVGNGIGVRPG